MKVRKLKTPKGRLLAVARLIEESPGLWDQTLWTDNHVSPYRVATESTCGSFGCAAGWGVAMSSPAVMNGGDFWTTAGAKAFGIGQTTAPTLFDDLYGNNPGRRLTSKRTRARRMVKALRWLATLSDEQRLHGDYDVAAVVYGIGRGEIRNPQKVWEERLALSRCPTSSLSRCPTSSPSCQVVDGLS